MESGSACLLTCRAGFRKTGDPVCKSGRWSVERCEELTCDKMVPIMHSMGAGRNVSHCRGKRSGEICSHFACDKGYVKVGELACRGVNFNHPRCEEAPCLGGPPVIEHSMLDLRHHCRLLAHQGNPIASRTICIVTCRKGYTKTGDTVC